jgi:glycosyltransferase involved in cell wall biosynthesis
MPYRLGILSSHPIQYQTPWLRSLAAHPELEVKVFFCQIPDSTRQGAEFGIKFEWDIPLLEGLDYEVLNNVAHDASLGRFRSCDTPAIGQHIRAGSFDAFLVNGWNVKSYLQAASASRRLGLPCLVRGDSNALKSRPCWKRWLLQHLLRKFSAYLVVGKSNADLYRLLNVPEERLFPAWHYVDNQRFVSQSQKLRGERRALQAQWGIPPETVVFLFCAKFIEKKRPFDFLEALDKARAHNVRIHGLMVGEGELKSGCEQMARARQLPVTFAGFLNQSEIAKAYVAADCVVLPSDFGETWGLVVNEAMATGLPAIVSDRVGCGPDLIIEGRTGNSFPFGDTEFLSRLFVYLARDRQTLLAMGRAAQCHVACYSVEAATEGTLQAVRYVTQRARS